MSTHWEVSRSLKASMGAKVPIGHRAGDPNTSRPYWRLLVLWLPEARLLGCRSCGLVPYGV